MVPCDGGVLLVARYTATAVPDDATAAGRAEPQMTAVFDVGQNSHANFAHLAAAPGAGTTPPRARPSGRTQRPEIRMYLNRGPAPQHDVDHSDKTAFVQSL